MGAEKFSLAVLSAPPAARAPMLEGALATLDDLLEVTGAASPMAALAAVRGWREEHARATAELAAITEDHARLTAELSTIESKRAAEEHLAALDELSASGRLTPAMRYERGADGEITGLAAPWSRMTAAELRRHGKFMPVLAPRGLDIIPATAEQRAAHVGPGLKRELAKLGVTPEEHAKVAAAEFRGELELGGAA